MKQSIFILLLILSSATLMASQLIIHTNDGGQHPFELSDIASITFTTEPDPQNFVQVQGGTFNNGTSEVSISSFYLCMYELTQSEYQAVMGNNPSHFPGVVNGPVEQVSWFNAIAYCNRRSLSEGLIPCYTYGTYGNNPDNWPFEWDEDADNHTNVACNWTANGYRLPTEAEWEFAARGGNQTHNYVYSGGNDINAVAWWGATFGGNSGTSTNTVGTRAANELGLFDMSGNVDEWIWDIYGTYPGGSQNNPTGANSGADRVLRGGSWSSGASVCEVSFRNFCNAIYNDFLLGFRICRISP